MFKSDHFDWGWYFNTLQICPSLLEAGTQDNVDAPIHLPACLCEVRGNQWTQMKHSPQQLTLNGYQIITEAYITCELLLGLADD